MSEKNTPAMTRLSAQGQLPSLSGAVEWLNSNPLAASELLGEVVLVDFWTYTCVNWTRTLPYVRAWAAKYKRDGLVVIGVHTPEFSFEKNIANVRQAIKEMGIEYPVAIDSNYAIWNAFENAYWPALYFVDAQGRIRHHVFGEGDYQESERIIQQLLAEAGHGDVAGGLVSVDPRGLEVAADWNDLKSPENFLGYERTQGFASAGEAILDHTQAYTAPASLELNQWAVSGDWTLGSEAIVLSKPNGRIAYRFHARDLNLVMGPQQAGTGVRFRVFVDRQEPGTDHGTDVDARGYGTVSEQRTYQLIRQAKPIVDRRFEIEFLDSGVEAFDFTFG
jgi:thiol-disulfide isomerase/thioredoxin